MDRATEDAKDRRRARDTGHGHAGGVDDLPYATVLNITLIPPEKEQKKSCRVSCLPAQVNGCLKEQMRVYVANIF